MSYEMNFEMYVGKKEQRADVLRVAKNALIANGYEEFADNFLFFHVSVFFAHPAPFFNVQAFSHAVKSRFPIFQTIVANVRSFRNSGAAGFPGFHKGHVDRFSYFCYD